MPVWNTKPVSEQPQITLIQWSVIETELHERHFCGYCIENGEGRVSSAIQTFDPKTRRGVTRSGRCYALEGPSGMHPDAAYVWSVWAQVNNVKRAVDVSEQLLGSNNGKAQRSQKP
jgi:hypothetical protein